MTFPNSVLTRSVTAQPVSPASGDRYLIPTAATGTDWAGKDGRVGIYKGSRWFFAIIPVGRLLYVEDETAFYHRSVLGVWTAGVGSIAIGANSIPITALIGANASFVIKVENQTTNAPPASPVAPTAYIIGSSPTGAWAGHAGDLAICLTAGSFTIIDPVAGDVVYDKALAKTVTFTGTAWDAANNALVLIETKVASSSATIDFLLPQTDIYDAFEFRISNLKVSVDDVDVWLRVGTGAGPTYQTSGYDYSIGLLNAGSTNVGGGTSVSAVALTFNSATVRLGNAAGENFSGKVAFNNPEASDFCEFQWNASYSRSTGITASVYGGGRYNTAGAITGIRLLPSSGNFAAGRVSLYGYRKT